MAYKNLSEYINVLEREGELIRVKGFVNPLLEIAEITDRFSKQPDGGKALLFENNGTGFPVLTNAMGSNKRICLALGVENLDNFGDQIQRLMSSLTSEKKTFFDKIKLIPQFAKIGKWIPRSVSRKGKCQEVISLEPDLNMLPILKCWPADGGRFVTLPMVHTIDPLSGVRNMGMYRMQVIDKNLTAMHWHIHKTGARHYQEYKKLGKRMPVVVTLGGDPAYTYSATAPLPDGIDEYILAGFIRKKQVELVKCITQNLEVPSDVDFVIEGYVDPEEDLFWEGPFGDHTGFYSLEDWYPKFHITCITHRKNAIYPATIVGVPPQEDAWIAEATSKIFFTPIKFSFVPEIAAMDLPVAGVAHNLAIVAINKRYPGQAFKVINALWGAGQMMFNKVTIVVDESFRNYTYFQLFSIISKQIQIPGDLLFGKGPLDILDHASDSFAYGGKLGIDATNMSLEDSIVERFDSDLSDFFIEHPCIELFSIDYLKRGIPVLLFNLKSDCKVLPHDILVEIANLPGTKKVKIMICLDSGTDLNDAFLLTWLSLGNTDPVRDYTITVREPDGINCLLIDATSKTKHIHGFNRPWPNIVTSSENTIGKVDNKWKELFGTDSIPSPSLNFIKIRQYAGSTAFPNK